MEKVEALENIKRVWDDDQISLGEKIISISTDFYNVGLDLSTTAAYIKATPAELDALLSLGGLDDTIIDMISAINPPKTTWQLIANASDSEIIQALNVLAENKNKPSNNRTSGALSEYVYQQMLEVAGPTTEQMVGMLSGTELNHALKKGENFNALTDWDIKFMKSIISQKKRGKTLSAKQITVIKKILDTIVQKGAIVRNSIDGDEEICDKILDAIGK